MSCRLPLARARSHARIARQLLFAIATVGAFGCSADRAPARVASNTGQAAGQSAPTQGAAGAASPNQAGAGAPDNPVPLEPISGTGTGSGSAGTMAMNAPMSTEPLPSCVQAAQEAERVPVDMYVMLDRSASMQGVTGAGPTKWDAIRDALRMFIRDPRSEGLGVGLQYFPIGNDGVPTSCTQDSECGSGGPCLTRACAPPSSGNFPLILCLSEADCPADAVGCLPIGTCMSDSSIFCFDVGPRGCGLRDPCVGVVSECAGFASCESGVYAEPAVSIGALPGRAQALIDSLTAAAPLGRTPTSAALSGALARARQQAMAEPTHRVVTVLATDGEPTECEPIEPGDVGKLASQGLADSPSVPTYVIGVFGEDETEARSNLNAWADAGGTSSAFIIDPGQDVAAQFLDALERIRSGSIACEYLLPPTPVGSELDLDRVNVALVEGQDTRDFLYVGEEGRCDRADLGWYYDAPPESGKATKIVACGNACDALKTTDGGRVEIRVGCKTLEPD